MIAFDVVGTPKPQGSMKAVPAGGFTKVVPSGGSGFAQWRNAVADKAQHLAAEHGRIVDPVFIHVTFRFAWTSGRLKVDRQRGWAFKGKAPDVDKLLRALLDGLVAGGLLRDDGQVVVAHAIKIEVYDGWTGAAVRIEPAAVAWPAAADMPEQGALL